MGYRVQSKARYQVFPVVTVIGPVELGRVCGRVGGFRMDGSVGLVEPAMGCGRIRTSSKGVPIA